MLAGIAAMLMAASAQAPAAEIADIRMHLFYRASGRLSDDISPPRAFVGWNTLIGEGDAEEPADDLLVVVQVRSEGEQYIETPLHILARGRAGRVIAERRFDALLTSPDGAAFSPLWLADVPCEGEISVVATFGSQRVSEALTLECGE